MSYLYFFYYLFLCIYLSCHLLSSFFYFFILSCCFCLFILFVVFYLYSYCFLGPGPIPFRSKIWARNGLGRGPKLEPNSCHTSQTAGKKPNEPMVQQRTSRLSPTDGLSSARPSGLLLSSPRPHG